MKKNVKPKYLCVAHDECFKLLREDITEMKKDIKDLLSFKWKIAGVLAFVAFAATFAVNISRSLLK